MIWSYPKRANRHKICHNLLVTTSEIKQDHRDFQFLKLHSGRCRNAKIARVERQGNKGSAISFSLKRRSHRINRRSPSSHCKSQIRYLFRLTTNTPEVIEPCRTSPSNRPATNSVRLAQRLRWQVWWTPRNRIQTSGKQQDQLLPLKPLLRALFSNH